MEGVFSSLMYASSNQNMQERTSQSRPPSIYKPPQQKETLATFTRQISGAPDTQQGTPDARPPAFGALGLATCPPLNLARHSNGHLRTTGRDQVRTGRVQYSPNSCAESL